MKQLLLFTCLSVFSASFFSCKKSDSNAATLPDVLMNKNWKLTTFTFKLNGSAAMDALSFWDDCEKDDYYIFKAGGHFTLDEGATKCDPSDPQQHTDGTWSYNASTKLLVYTTINASGDRYEWTITSANENSFSGTGHEVLGSDTYDYNVTFTKQ